MLFVLTPPRIVMVKQNEIFLQVETLPPSHLHTQLQYHRIVGNQKGQSAVQRVSPYFLYSFLARINDGTASLGAFIDQKMQYCL